MNPGFAASRLSDMFRVMNLSICSRSRRALRRANDPDRADVLRLSLRVAQRQLLLDRLSREMQHARVASGFVRPDPWVSRIARRRLPVFEAMVSDREALRDKLIALGDLVYVDLGGGMSELASTRPAVDDPDFPPLILRLLGHVRPRCEMEVP